jgi:hypothetical protein
MLGVSFRREPGGSVHQRPERSSFKSGLSVSCAIAVFIAPCSHALHNELGEHSSNRSGGQLVTELDPRSVRISQAVKPHTQFARRIDQPAAKPSCARFDLALLVSHVFLVSIWLASFILARLTKQNNVQAESQAAPA